MRCEQFHISFPVVTSRFSQLQPVCPVAATPLPHGRCKTETWARGACGLISPIIWSCKDANRRNSLKGF